jgi:hydrogenase-4 component F
MNNNIIHLLPLICSFSGAVLSLIPFRYAERIASIIASHAAFFSAVYILFQPDYTSGYFYIDGLSKLLILTVAMVYISTVLYSIAYLRHIKNPLFQKKLYYFLLNIFASTMFFSVSMDNIGLIWVGIEATTVSSALLVATENDQATVESAWRYVIIVSTGLVISLIATTFIFGSSGTLSIKELLQHHPDNRVFLIGMLLALVGFGTKAGIFPMHTWLPDVHGKAPSPVSAIFSGVLLPVALYAMARIILIDPEPVVKIFALVLGVLTVGVAALMMTVQNNYKRMFAYSSMENMGMILIGFALGKYGLLGAAIIIVSHGLAKSAVFFFCGDVLSTYGSTKIEDVNGLMKKSPRTASGLFLSALAVTGAPPFAIFIGELFIFAALIQQYGSWLAIIVMLFLAITFIAVNFRTGKMIFSGVAAGAQDSARIETWVPVINLTLSLLVLVFIPYFEQLLQKFL